MENQTKTVVSDLRQQGPSNVPSYRGLLEAFAGSGFAFRTHVEYFAASPVAGRAIYLRHDVDRVLDTALHMAHIERDLGIRASYYFLPPGDYDRDDNYFGRIVRGHVYVHPAFIEAVHQVADLGHEVGLHNDFLQLAAKTGRDVPAVMEELLAVFRNAGIPVQGTASHGSKFASQRQMTNYQVFSEYRRASSENREIDLGDGRRFPLYSVSYRALGLSYEAYEIKRDVYVSDSGGRFTVNKEHWPDVTEEKMRTALADKQSVIALLHPEWWKTIGGEVPASTTKPAPKKKPGGPLRKLRKMLR